MSQDPATHGYYCPLCTNTQFLQGGQRVSNLQVTKAVCDVPQLIYLMATLNEQYRGIETISSNGFASCEFAYKSMSLF